jgi:hypothetical protein
MNLSSESDNPRRKAMCKNKVVEVWLMKVVKDQRGWQTNWGSSGRVLGALAGRLVMQVKMQYEMG